MACWEYLEPSVINIQDDVQIVEPEIDGVKFQITVKQVREAFLENIGILKFLSAIDSHLINLTLTEYSDMPALTLEALEIFRYEKQKLIQSKVK